MPPKPKFTREEITAAALDLVSERGIDALTARDLGVRLGSSARPIFTVFKNMEEVQQAVRQAAMERLETFSAGEGGEEMPPFKQYGMKMIRFGREEPKLFQLLFMTETDPADSFSAVIDRLGDWARECVAVIRRDYRLDRQDAEDLFQHMWLHAYGIGTLCATGVCRFTDEEISTMLSRDFRGQMYLLREDGLLNWA